MNFTGDPYALRTMNRAQTIRTRKTRIQMYLPETWLWAKHYLSLNFLKCKKKTIIVLTLKYPEVSVRKVHRGLSRQRCLQWRPRNHWQQFISWPMLMLPNYSSMSLQLSGQEESLPRYLVPETWTQASPGAMSTSPMNPTTKRPPRTKQNQS